MAKLDWALSMRPRHDPGSVKEVTPRHNTPPVPYRTAGVNRHRQLVVGAPGRVPSKDAAMPASRLNAPAVMPAYAAVRLAAP